MHKASVDLEGGTKPFGVLCKQSKDRIRCFTDGCDGVIKLALELQFDSGIEISRKELLKLPDEPKKAAHAPAQPAEQRKKANKQKPAQKAPAASAGVLPSMWASKFCRLNMHSKIGTNANLTRLRLLI